MVRLLTRTLLRTPSVFGGTSEHQARTQAEEKEEKVEEGEEDAEEARFSPQEREPSP